MKVKVAAFTILLSTTLSASALEVGDTPWLTWGEGSYAWSDSGSEEGLKLDAFFKSVLKNSIFCYDSKISAAKHSDFVALPFR